ncbi:hypothetical protein DB41_IP00120 [Neochlamydia sp. TUME1]|nr:hypothetical protein DB41_IP00120 [Neochlamydia sp. TUME1]
MELFKILRVQYKTFFFIAKFLQVNKPTADNFIDAHGIFAKEFGIMVFNNSFGLRVKKTLSF